MGKMVTYLSILIFIDLLMIVTGQICASGTCTLSSTIIASLLNIGEITFKGFFTGLIGVFSDLGSSTTGLFSLIGAGAVIVTSFIATREFRILIIPMTATLALLTSDFIIISSKLISLNPVAAIFIMGPISIIYTLTVMEWWRGKD